MVIKALHLEAAVSRRGKGVLNGVVCVQILAKKNPQTSRLRTIFERRQWHLGCHAVDTRASSFQELVTATVGRREETTE